MNFLNIGFQFTCSIAKPLATYFTRLFV